MSPEINPNNVLSTVLAGQFAVFGWRIVREITVGDAGRRTWLPVPDLINLLSMLGTLALCVVNPFIVGQYTRASFAILAAAAVLLVFHPICLAGHYRLFTAEGRHVYTKAGKDYPYCTGMEGILVTLAVVSALVAGSLVYSGS